MKLHHFTSLPLAEAILSSSISDGHLMRANGELITKVVWFTTDRDSEGHGLMAGLLIDADAG